MGDMVTGDGKILKLACIGALFAGIATLVLGVVLAVGNLMDIDAWITAFEGLCSTIFGVRCAILANVPSNTAKIRTKAIVLSVASVAVVAALVAGGFEVTVGQLAMAGVIGVIALVALMVASRIVKEQLRK